MVAWKCNMPQPRLRWSNMLLDLEIKAFFFINIYSIWGYTDDWHTQTPPKKNQSKFEWVVRPLRKLHCKRTFIPVCIQIALLTISCCMFNQALSWICGLSPTNPACSVIHRPRPPATHLTSTCPPTPSFWKLHTAPDHSHYFSLFFWMLWGIHHLFGN